MVTTGLLIEPRGKDLTLATSPPKPLKLASSLHLRGLCSWVPRAAGDLQKPIQHFAWWIDYGHSNVWLVIPDIFYWVYIKKESVWYRNPCFMTALCPVPTCLHTSLYKPLKRALHQPKLIRDLVDHRDPRGKSQKSHCFALYYNTLSQCFNTLGF